MPIPSPGTGGEEDAPGKWLNWSQAPLAQPGLRAGAMAGQGQVLKLDEGSPLPPPHAWEQGVSRRPRWKDAVRLAVQRCSWRWALGWSSGAQGCGKHSGDNGVVEI